jgi:hypothetical protein
LSRTFDDNRSVGSGKSGDRQPLLARLFFENDGAKVAAPIGDPILSGEYPWCDKKVFWISSSHPNSHKV